MWLIVLWATTEPALRYYTLRNCLTHLLKCWGMQATCAALGEKRSSSRRPWPARRGSALTRRARASWKEARASLAHEPIAEEAASSAGSSASSAGGGNAAGGGAPAEGGNAAAAAAPVAISVGGTVDMGGTGGTSASGQDTPPSPGPLTAESDASARSRCA